MPVEVWVQSEARAGPATPRNAAAINAQPIDVRDMGSPEVLLRLAPPPLPGNGFLAETSCRRGNPRELAGEARDRHVGTRRVDPARAGRRAREASHRFRLPHPDL